MHTRTRGALTTSQVALPGYFLRWCPTIICTQGMPWPCCRLPAEVVLHNAHAHKGGPYRVAAEVQGIHKRSTMGSSFNKTYVPVLDLDSFYAAGKGWEGFLSPFYWSIGRLFRGSGALSQGAPQGSFGRLRTLIEFEPSMGAKSLVVELQWQQ
eukprot:1157946-Pelagomonas_calceolata.AAC.3